MDKLRKKTIKQSSEAPAIKSKYENVKISIDTKNILNSDKNIFKCKKGPKRRAVALQETEKD